ncbi:hypothetical protein M902_2567 [Bacteriovorax sp. BAL6_X]|uniref:hypothetical protein n=1 Tax=Bacteriovorax sp. BAL6_X TaxID=1201290 RepID=UPI00038556B0|nr:hypothetical protein [Bacteriovorax sp. BAL6_X]EPZ51102.1 hypothetical protein M902_2567 [Bacteriovorax sp. BAL6_X]
MKKKIYFTLFILAIIAGLLGWGILNYPKSDGTRSGKLVRITKKGVFFKTYEGTIDLGSGDRLTWGFSVHDKALGEQLVAQAGKNVKLEYKELFFKFIYETNNVVDGWSIVESAEDNVFLCRLVRILQENSSIVEYLRPRIQEQDSELLQRMRNCK